MGGTITTIVSVINLAGGLFVVACGYNWPKISSFVACVTLPLVIASTVVKSLAGGNNETFQIISIILGLVLACVCVYVSWKYAIISRIIVGLGFGASFGFMIYMAIFYPWARTAVVELLIVIIAGVVCALASLKRFRLVAIVESSFYGAYLVSNAVGDFFGKSPTLYPFKPVYKADWPFYIIFAGYVLLSIAGVWYQLKHTTPPADEKKLTARNLFSRETDEDPNLLEAGKKGIKSSEFEEGKSGGWSIFGGGAKKATGSQFGKGGSAYEEDAEPAPRPAAPAPSKKRAGGGGGGDGSEFGTSGAFGGIGKSGADDFGRF